MKIKIGLLIITFKLLIITTAFAQDKEPAYSLKIYGGYSPFTPGSDRLYTGSVLGIQAGSTGSYSSSNRGLGAGLNYGLGVERTLGELFSVGLDLNYLKGAALSSSYSTYPPASTNITYVTYNGSASHSVLSIIPNISFKALTKPNYYLYTRLGVITAIKTKYQSTGSYVLLGNGTLATTENYSQTNKYGINLGLNAAAGIRFNLIGPLKGTFEINDNFLSVSPTSGTENAYLVEGPYAESFHYNINYTKSKSGSLSSQQITSNNGYVGTATINQTQPSFNQHINNIVLTVGVAIAIK